MLRSFFAGLLTIFFNFVFVLSFIFYVLLNTFLSEDFYEGEFVSYVKTAAVDLVIEKIEEDGGGMFDVDPADARNILLDTVEDKDVSEIFVSVLNQITSDRVYEGGSREIVLDITPITKRVPEFAEKFSVEICEKSPECTDEIAQIASKFTTITEKELFKEVPSRFRFSLPEVSAPLFNESVYSQSFLWKFWWATFVIQLLLLGLIGIIIFEPWHKIAKWIGSALLSSSISVTVLFLLSTRIPGMVGGSSVVVDVSSDIFGLMAAKAFYFVSAIFVVSIALLVVGFLGKHNE